MKKAIFIVVCIVLLVSLAANVVLYLNLDTAQSNSRYYSSRYSQIKQENETLKSTINQAQVEINQLEEEIEPLNKELADQKAKADEYYEYAVQLQNEVETANEELTEQKAKAQEYYTYTLQSSSQISNLKDQIDDYKDDIKIYQDTIEQMEAEMEANDDEGFWNLLSFLFSLGL